MNSAEKQQPDIVIRYRYSGVNMEEMSFMAPTILLQANRQGFRLMASQFDRCASSFLNDPTGPFSAYDHFRLNLNEQFSSITDIRTCLLTKENFETELSRYQIKHETRQNCCMTYWIPKFINATKQIIESAKDFETLEESLFSPAPQDEVIEYTSDRLPTDGNPYIIMRLTANYSEDDHDQIYAYPSILILANREGFRYLAALMRHHAERNYFIYESDPTGDPDDHCHEFFGFEQHVPYDQDLSMWGEIRFGVFNEVTRDSAVNKYDIPMGSQNGCLTRWMPNLAKNALKQLEFDRGL